MFTVNYHTHTERCHHAGCPDRQYVEFAVNAGFKVLGFADHSPQIFPGKYYSDFRMYPYQTEEYFASILALKEEFKDRIDIKIGFEAEYYPDIFPDLLKHLAAFPCDYLILGQHFLNNEFDHPENPRRGSTEYIFAYVDQVCAAMRTGYFTYLCHPDLPWVDEFTPAYYKAMEKLIECAMETEMPLEINCLGIADHRNYPHRPFWELVGKMGAPVTVGLDAHDPYMFVNEYAFTEAQKIIDDYHLTYVEPVLRPLPKTF
ncbi:MAG: histidinol-phosphatase HisJ family protein [Ruminococcaceae bacterium]|nr:histidinol-phosphatase HisJ family protein [Oscillospiraceae bacterium]